MAFRGAARLLWLTWWLKAARVRSIAAARCLWQSLRRRHRHIPVEVLIADRGRRRMLEREIRISLSRLRRALGDMFPAEMSVVAQNVIGTDRPLAGCYHVGRRPDGSPFVLLRLALQRDGCSVTRDQLLAVLAEQCIDLALQQSGAPSSLVPVDLGSQQPRVGKRLVALPPDPLAPSRGPFASREGAA